MPLNSFGKFDSIVLEPDDIVVVESGGGGYGDPGKRPRATVLTDLRRGYISTSAAINDYGLTPTDLEKT
jgi:N-methylhydantoinase B